MAADPTTLATANALEASRAKRALRNRFFDGYYRGTQAPPNVPAKLSTAYAALLARSSSPWMRLIVQSSVERLTVEGFRTSKGDADDAVWEWWQANNLDSGSRMVHTEAQKCGISYASVWVPDKPGGPPLIRAEHPSQVFAEYEPGDPFTALRAIKVWKGLDALWYATYYEPDRIVKWATDTPDTKATTPPPFDGGAWVERDGGEMTNPVGVVPFVPFRNDPDMLGNFQSEIEPAIPIAERINSTLFSRLLAQEFSAFRQKWATGIDVPRDPITNEPIEPYDAAVDRLWISENPDSRFGEFGESSLGGYIAAIEADIQHLAAITRTPPHYLLGQSGAFPSGESLKATETGLMAKVNEKQVHMGESWEHVARLAAKVAESDIAEDTALETIWKNTESRTQGELVDSLLKLATLGVPQETLWTIYGFSPQAIERMKEQRTDQAASTDMGLIAAGLAKAPPGEPSPKGGVPTPGKMPEIGAPS